MCIRDSNRQRALQGPRANEVPCSWDSAHLHMRNAHTCSALHLAGVLPLGSSASLMSVVLIRGAVAPRALSRVT
eukprot:2397290-Pyramimonas_sp.AAC.1